MHVITRPALSLGIEEEYLLVDRETRNLVSDPDEGLWESAQEALGAKAMPEFLRAQLEVATGVHSSVAEAGEELVEMRASLNEALEKHGAALMAASTHPFALWWEQQPTDKDRYKIMAEDLGMVARRMVICGMHVHAGIEDARSAHRPDEPNAVHAPASPQPFDVLAVLGLATDRAEELPDLNLPHDAPYRSAG